MKKGTKLILKDTGEKCTFIEADPNGNWLVRIDGGVEEFDPSELEEV